MQEIRRHLGHASCHSEDYPAWRSVMHLGRPFVSIVRLMTLKFCGGKRPVAIVMVFGTRAEAIPAHAIVRICGMQGKTANTINVR